MSDPLIAENNKISIDVVMSIVSELRGELSSFRQENAELKAMIRGLYAEKPSFKPKKVSDYSKENNLSVAEVNRRCVDGRLNAWQKKDGANWYIFPQEMSKKDKENYIVNNLMK